MPERTYDIGGFVLAYLAYRTYGALDNELGHYHRARYAALKAASGVDVEADADERIFAQLFERAAQQYLATTSPFEGMLECPARVYEAVVGHERRMRELCEATRAELLALMCTAFAAVWGPAYRPVAERALAVHGFDGGPEPDPIDFW